MQTLPLLLPEQIACLEELSSRKRVFEKLAELLTQQQTLLGAEAVFEALTNREKLGSTTLGNGIAIPHACLNISAPLMAVVALVQGVKMDTPDKKPVQIFLAIIVPDQDNELYRATISQLAILLTQPSLIENLPLHNQTHETLLTYLNKALQPLQLPNARLAA
jgi:PTS system nitrogen regulatory IIA component